MVFVWMFCAHEFSDHPMPVSNDVVNLEACIFKLLNSPLQTLQLHVYRAFDFITPKFV